MDTLPVRKPNRLSGYDYSRNGAYFITICVKDRAELLGTIESTDNAAVGANCVRPRSYIRPRLRVRPQLSKIGTVVENEIFQLSETYGGVYVDCFVIMPNHVHMIIVIDGGGTKGRTNEGTGGGTNEGTDEGMRGRTQFAPTVSRVIKQWKGAVTKRIGFPIWQRSYHDHIIRNERDHARIAEYIENNPRNWRDDCFYAGNNGTSKFTSIY
jgi:REP element-mobilizing transposase RayT